ncbi:ISNCY family transposase, partial [bacterium]
DGTVVETNIHPPSDSSLLVDSVRVLGRTLSRAKAVLKEEAHLGRAVFRNRLRSVRRLARQAGEAMRKGGETAQTQGKAAYRRLVQATQATIRQAEQVCAALEKQGSEEAQKLAQILATFLPRAEQVVSQTVRRVFDGEQVPAPEKIVSLFEPHTAIIRRNKAHKPTEYGHKVWLDEVDGGIVTRWQVLEGNPSDKEQWKPSLEHHLQQFGHPPHQASADRGVYSSANEAIAQQKGVQHVILPKPGQKSEARKQHEKQRWFRQGRRWHAGIEGRISVLKRRNGLDRCRDHGEQGFARWVGWGVIANNLHVIGQKMATRA